MTQEEKRIKIAQLCGWKPYPKENVGAAALMFNGDVWFRDEKTDTIATPSQLPDYFSDLNAMNEAEKMLTGNNRARYHLKLMQLSDGPNAKYLTCEESLCHATAEERAEMLGRTLNLWRKSK